MNIKQQIVNQLTTAIKAKNQPLVMSIFNGNVIPLARVIESYLLNG